MALFRSFCSLMVISVPAHSDTHTHTHVLFLPHFLSFFFNGKGLKGTMHRRAKEKRLPLVKRAGAGLPPPSPVVPSSVALDRDAEALQAMLQEMDEVFCVNDGDNERQRRLNQIGEQQMALQRLCEAALQQEERLNSVAVRHKAAIEFADDRPVDAGIVLTPRSLESFSTYGDPGATGMGRSASRNDTGSQIMSAPPLPLCELTKEASATRNTAASFCSYRGHMPPAHIEAPAVATVSAGITLRRASLPPLSSPPLDEEIALEEDRRLIEEFLGVMEVESTHPYAAVGNERKDSVKEVAPKLKLQRFSWNRGTTHTTPVNSSPLARDASHEENFDVREEEQLLKSIMQKKPRPPEDPLQGAHAGSVSRSSDVPKDVKRPTPKKEKMLHGEERSFSTLSGTTAAPSHKSGKLCLTAAPLNGEHIATGPEKESYEDVKFTHAGEIQELLRKNGELQKEIEAQDVALRDLTQKTESLARHLVNSMRERNKLHSSVERLEESLARANSELGRFQRAVEEQNKVSRGVDLWRATAHAKERELRICEEELSLLRGIVEQRVMRSGNVVMQQAGSTALAQVKSDLEDLIIELASAHVLRREAEIHAERVSEELEAAQSHIQLIDNRLAEAEKTVAFQRLQEMRERLLSGNDMSLPLPSLPTLPSFSMLLEGNVAAWPIDARREIARLANYAESLVAQHAESDRYAELRLSEIRRENEELRERCRAYESGVKKLEDETETIRRERMMWKLSEQRWQQLLLDVQEDAALVTDLLQNRVKGAEKVLDFMTVPHVEHEVKTEMEAFLKNAMRDWDTAIRFTTALQRMEIGSSELQKQEWTEKFPLSTATRTRREFVLQAIETAMAQKASSSCASPQPKPPKQGQRLLAPDPASLPPSLFLSRTTSTQKLTTVVDDEKWKEKVESVSWPLHAPEVKPRALSPPRPSFTEGGSDVTRGEKYQTERHRREGVPMKRVDPLQPPAVSPRESLIQPLKDREIPLFPHHYDHRKIREVSPTREIRHSQSREGKKRFPFTPKREELSFKNLPGYEGTQRDSAIVVTPAEPSHGNKGIEVFVSGAIFKEEGIADSTTNEETVVPPVHSLSTCATETWTNCSQEVEHVAEPPGREDNAGLRSVTPTTPVVPAVTSTNTFVIAAVETVEGCVLGGEELRLHAALGQRLQRDDAREKSGQAPNFADIRGNKDFPTILVSDSMLESKNNKKKLNKLSREDWNDDVDDANNEPRLHLAAPIRRSGQTEKVFQHENSSSYSPAEKSKEVPLMNEPNKADDKEKELSPILSLNSKTKRMAMPDVRERIRGGAAHVPALSRSLLDTQQSRLDPSLQEPRQVSCMTPVAQKLSEEAETVVQNSVTEESVSVLQETEKETAPVVGESSDPGGRRRPSAVMDFPSLRHSALGPGGRRQLDVQKI
ncbi:hook complex protein, conserved [Trypanosoma cruzi]|uniref:Hook complex protein, conserved n=1 Tax=Trypanosoma cruzi TaxID=5693 RepID=A0A2V2V5P2_TRYCR|nr:hook complex protein, conserved [Trypanosoma cruzi]